MKKSIVFFSFIISALSFGQQALSEALPPQKFKGKVKSSRVTQYQAVEKEKNIEKGVILEENYLAEFSEQGKMTSMISFNEKNQPIIKSLFTYTEDNQPLYQVIFQGIYPRRKWFFKYDDRKNKTQVIFVFDNDTIKTNYVYDAKNQLVEESVFDKGIEIKKTEFSYDNKGNKVSETFYSEGKFWNKKTYSYNDKGQEIETILYNDKNIIDLHFKFRYDSKGNKIEELTLEPNGAISTRTAFEYNSDKLLILKEIYNNQNALVKKYTYAYNSDKKEIENCVYWNNGAFMRKFSYAYTEQGDICSEEETGYATNKRTLDYQYDTQGNWVKIIYTKGDKPLYVIERTLEYY